MERPKSVLATDSIPWAEENHGRNSWKRKRLGAAAGGTKIGTSLIELAPGKRSWPQHYHLANEEAVFVLEGEGTLRLGKQELAISAGDYIALPSGDPEQAHQIVHHSGAPLRYL